MNLTNHQTFKRLEVANQIPNDPDTESEELIVWNGTLFSGLSTDSTLQAIVGIFGGAIYFRIYPYGKVHAISFYSCHLLENGYAFNGTDFQTRAFGLGLVIECTYEDEYWNIHDADLKAEDPLMAMEYKGWMSDRACQHKRDKNLHRDGRDYFELYEQQVQWKAKVIPVDALLEPIRYIAAIDVGYDLLDLRIAASLVLYDLETKQIVLTKTNQADIQLPHYCTDLFPHTDLEVVKPLFQELPIRPDLVLCNAQGLAHPRRLGLACYLGVELGLPTFGCTRDRVVGGYEPTDLKAKVGSIQPLKWAGQVGVGNALRISTGKLPVFVSAGHQITLETATKWTRKLKKVKIEGMDSTDRQLQLLQKAEQLVNQQLEERTKLVWLETV